MGYLIILVIIAIFAIFIFVNIKISNFKYRAKQQLLRNTGISNSDINSNINESIEKKHLQNFLSENNTYTEESIKELLKKCAINLLQKNVIPEFTQDVCEKIQRDSKLDKLKDTEFKKVFINHYKNLKLTANVVFSDNRDEYNIALNCTVTENNIQVYNYMIIKGAVLGF